MAKAVGFSQPIVSLQVLRTDKKIMRARSQQVVFDHSRGVPKCVLSWPALDQTRSPSLLPVRKIGAVTGAVTCAGMTELI
jgi:hypothetical protein